MLFSTKAEYGVRLMVELGRQSDRGPVSLTSIAETENLPLSYLEHLVAKLRRADLVTSTRGAQGGYRLARPPAEIHLDEVVDCLEGPPTTSRARTGEDHSPDFAVLEALEDRLQQAQRRILRQTRLDQLLEERQNLSEPQPMFFI